MAKGTGDMMPPRHETELQPGEVHIVVHPPISVVGCIGLWVRCRGVEWLGGEVVTCCCWIGAKDIRVGIENGLDIN